MGNVMRTFDAPSTKKCQDHIPGILSAMSYGVRGTAHTTARATPMQLVFGRDGVPNVPHLADWKCIQSRKQTEINRNNAKENRKRKTHAHQLNECVLVKNDWTSKYGTTSYKGPCEIVKINDNGTVQIRMDNVLDTCNIRNMKPHNN